MKYRVYGKSKYGGRQKPRTCRTKKSANNFAKQQRKKGWKSVTVRKVK